MKHLFMRYLLASSILTIGMPLWAEDFRVGFINTDRIFREANTAKVAQTKLEQEFSKREKELVDLGNSLKTNSEKLERDLPTLSETQRTTKQRLILWLEVCQGLKGVRQVHRLFYCLPALKNGRL